MTASLLTAPATGPTVARIGDVVRIHWWIDVGDRCHYFRAQAEASHDTLVATVVAEQRAEACLIEGARYQYTITVTGVSPAVDVLRLVYDWPGSPPYATTALEVPLGPS